LLRSDNLTWRHHVRTLLNRLSLNWGDVIMRGGNAV
jgi:hypothetical protein